VTHPGAAATQEARRKPLCASNQLLWLALTVMPTTSPILTRVPGGVRTVIRPTPFLSAILSSPLAGLR